MKFLSSASLASLFVVVALANPLSAAEKDKKAKLSEWKFGKVAFGEKISKKLTKDKVVVLEFWGVNCPPCIASLPHLAEMAKEKQDSGLVVIGAESQMSTPDQMKPLLEKAKVEYTITEGAEGPIEVSQLPRVFVFGKDGTLAFDGSPLSEEFKTAVDEALAVKGPADSAAVATVSNLIEEREWKNSAGTTIKAAVKSADATKASFVMPGGKVVDYPLDKLSQESRDVIAEALKRTASK